MERRIERHKVVGEIPLAQNEVQERIGEDRFNQNIFEHCLSKIHVHR